MADTDKHLTRILAAVDANGCVEDSANLAKDMGVEHKVLVGCIKSLEASESVVTEVLLPSSCHVSDPFCFAENHDTSAVQAIAHSRLALTPEAQDYITAGHSPEAVVFNAVPADGGEMPVIQSSVDKPVWSVGFKKAMEKGWVKMSKLEGKQVLSRNVQTIEDTCLASLKAVQAETAVADSVAAELKKRKLVKLEQWKTFKISKGPAFALEIVKPETDLTAELLQSGDWQNKQFKEYNFKVHPCCVCPHLPRLIPAFIHSPEQCGKQPVLYMESTTDLDSMYVQ